MIGWWLACTAPVDPVDTGVTAPVEDFDDAWQDLAAFEAQIAWLATLRGVVREPIGTSFEGRTIWAIRIRSAEAPDTPRPGFLVTALQHAREWVAGAAAMHIAERLAQGDDPVAQAVLEDWDVWVVPVVNPDGYRYSWTTDRLWRKNRATDPSGAVGVDLNRNWGHAWGGPGSRAEPEHNNFRGSGAFSEPETAALQTWVQATGALAAHLDLHSPGQLVLTPWAHTSTPGPDAEWLGAGAEAARAAMEAVNGHPYDAGTFHDRLYPGSGVAIDWTHARGLDSYLFELRDRGQFGFLLDDEQRALAVSEAWAGFVALATR